MITTKLFEKILIPTLFVLLIPSTASYGMSKKKPIDRTPAGDPASPYEPVLNNFRWIIPANGLPAGISPTVIPPQASNNNIAIEMFQGRLYMIWRSAPSHFAGTETKLHVVSSADLGKTWEFERTIATGRDLREPFFYVANDTLFLIYAELGTNPVSYDPHVIWRTTLSKNKAGKLVWSKPSVWVNGPEMPWEIKRRNGHLWMTSYTGNHYKTGSSSLLVHFRYSDDGYNWHDLRDDRNYVYVGGVSEVGFEFDSQNKLWAVSRNEDGDVTGFGSHVATAEAGDYGTWDFPAESNPNRYDSPRMFRHGEDIYMVARRDIGGPYDMGMNWLSEDAKKIAYLTSYSFRAKRTSLYRIDRSTRKVIRLYDLPSAGDTAFPSIVQLSEHKFLVGNYTSPLEYPDRDWFWGQVSPQGTSIYFVEIDFTPK